jgi:hypothetical protein
MGADQKIHGVRLRAVLASGLRKGMGALALCLCILMAPAPARAELIDRIAAAVNNDIITGSELAFAVSLNARFGAAGSNRKALEAETLDGLITRRMLVQEALRLKFVEISDQETAGEISGLTARFGSDAAFRAFLEEFGMTPGELSQMLRERLLVERFIEKKVGLFVRVTRDEAQSYFEMHRADYRGKRFQEVQKDILARLTRQKTGRQLDQYLAELRSKADIRVGMNGQPRRQGDPIR